MAGGIPLSGLFLAGAGRINDVRCDEEYELVALVTGFFVLEMASDNRNVDETGNLVDCFTARIAHEPAENDRASILDAKG